ncbi:MAG TPA: biotin--[acetyl-CoA-carboxylase] ligase [Xanthobacteraceae bacterium]|nr:biotin--[acetyl-CoA-carboxylase] ligase [Xanthobacteraceae bacterium]
MDLFPTRTGAIPVAWFETIGSTNAEALARAAAGERGPLLIVAERQSAGRGRRGREWVSEPGNLYATLLLSDPAPPSVCPQLCFVAALALHDAVLDGCAGLAPARLKLKWPNDLLLDSAKLAGILIEGAALANDAIAAAIGFGVNCAHHPADTQFPATDLAKAGFSLPPASLLERLGLRMEERRNEWDRGAGFAKTRAAWLLRAQGIGAEIEVRLPQETLRGTFESMNEQGELVLLRNGARQAISAGDVFPIDMKAN